MPSELHEILVDLFRNLPELAPTLLKDALHIPLPRYGDLQVVESTLNNVQPPEYRADLVIVMRQGARSVLGIVVEAQLGDDSDKRFAWPAYATNLRSRERCPVCLLVFAANRSTARWAAKTIEIGGGNTFTPLVIGPAGVPVVTDVNTTAPNRAAMIAQGRAVLRFRGHRRRGHSPFKVTAEPQGGAEQARAPHDWEQ